MFCGLNWTADEYGYPYDNATGMIEVFPILPLVRHVRQILPQAKDGVILHTSHLSARKTVPSIQEAFKDAGILLSTATTDTMDGFESQYRTAQESDLIFLFNNSTLSDWDNNRAKQITTTLPSKLTVTMNKWMMPYTMLGLTGLPEEQGEYAAKAVLKILHGTAPRDIPIVSNRKWHTYVNKRLLQQAGIRLSDEILNQAEKMRP